MSDPNTYDVTEIDALVDAARKKFRDKLAQDPDFFAPNIRSHNNGTEARIAATLSEDAPKGTLGVPAGVDAGSTAGIMRSVDLTILKRDASVKEVEDVAARAAAEHTATVCVYPEHVGIVSRVMAEKNVADVPPIAVVGFPSVPAPTAEVQTRTVLETYRAIASGAREIDMVLPENFREGESDYKAHYKYIKAVVDAAHEHGIPVKVILETAYLSDSQIVDASLLSKIAGADWVKTATGFAEPGKFAPGRDIEKEKGATPHVVAVMRRTVGDASLDDTGNVKPMGVKASGGVRNREQALAVLAAGADRIGASGGLDVRTLAEKAVASQSPGPEQRSAGY